MWARRRRGCMDRCRALVDSFLYSEEATQFKEARRVESTLGPQGRSAQLLFGKMELLL